MQFPEQRLEPAICSLRVASSAGVHFELGPAAFATVHGGMGCLLAECSAHAKGDEYAEDGLRFGEASRACASTFPSSGQSNSGNNLRGVT
jgi:hypothetical protein